MITITWNETKVAGTKLLKIIAITFFACLVLNQFSYDKAELENEVRTQTTKQS